MPSFNIVKQELLSGAHRHFNQNTPCYSCSNFCSIVSKKRTLLILFTSKQMTPPLLHCLRSQRSMGNYRYIHPAKNGSYLYALFDLQSVSFTARKQLSIFIGKSNLFQWAKVKYQRMLDSDIEFRHVQRAKVVQKFEPYISRH